MNQNLQDQNSNHKSSEEVDLMVLFRAIGNAFNRFFSFIIAIIKAIFSIFIYTLKTLFRHMLLIVLVMAVAAGIGYTLQKMKPDVFKSHMLVKPYFDSKYQLGSNIDYYNALIRERDYPKLTSIFDINEVEAKSIINFEITAGPETENERIIEYNKFIKSVDSTRTKVITYEEFLKNRSIYSGDVFRINVFSSKRDVFRALEEGLNSTFTNTHAKKKMEKRDSIVSLERRRIQSSLKEVDSLKRVYIKVLEEESKSDKMIPVSSSRDGGMAMMKERTNTREFELLEKQMKLRQELSSLEAQKLEENVFFETISSFQDMGSRYVDPNKRYVFIFPILAFILMAVGFMTFKLIKYVKNYED